MLSSIHIQKSRGKVPEIQDHTETYSYLANIWVKTLSIELFVTT